MPMRDSGTASLTAWRTALKPCHLGARGCLVDEDKMLRIKLGLALEPFFSRCIHRAASLLGSVSGLFLSVILRRSKKAPDRTDPGAQTFILQHSLQFSERDVGVRRHRAQDHLCIGLDASRTTIAALTFGPSQRSYGRSRKSPRVPETGLSSCRCPTDTHQERGYERLCRRDAVTAIPAQLFALAIFSERLPYSLWHQPIRPLCEKFQELDSATPATHGTPVDLQERYLR